MVFGRVTCIDYHQTATVAQSFSEEKAVIFPVDLIGRSSSFVCLFCFDFCFVKSNAWLGAVECLSRMSKAP